MLSLIQRVTRASVEVDGQVVGEIGDGLLALVGVEPGDGPNQLRRMAQKLLGYRVFADDAGKMNRSLADIGGGLLLVSQLRIGTWIDQQDGLHLRCKLIVIVEPEGRYVFANRSGIRTLEISRADLIRQLRCGTILL